MRPRDIGTRAETAVVKHLRELGWTAADRQPLRGRQDQGDILIHPDPRIIAEVKAGAQADTASPNQIRKWMAETDQEAIHAGADLAVLIVRRKGRAPAQWDAWMPAADWVTVMTGATVLPTDAPWPMRASLADWSDIVEGWVEG